MRAKKEVKPKIIGKWYTLEIEVDGKWSDAEIQEDDSIREMRKEMNELNFIGHRVRLIEHITTEQTIETRDFRELK